MRPYRSLLPSALVAVLVLHSPAGATIVVTTTADGVLPDGFCSLREAIDAANSDTPIDTCDAAVGPDVIELSGDTFVLEVPGAAEDLNVSGDFDVLDDLVVRGSGASQTVIDAGGLDRAFHVHEGVSLSLRNLAIEKGDAPGGGGIFNRGDLRLVGVEMRDNQAVLGGAVSSFGPLRLDSCRLTNNSATSGGAIYYDNSFGSPVELRRTVVDSNSATEDGGGLRARHFHLIASTVHGNVAGEDGGAVAVPSDAGHLNTIESSTLSGNHADGDGGAIHYDGVGRIRIRSSTITDNFADSAGPGLRGGGGDDGDGGGVFVAGTGTVQMANTVLAGNADLSEGTLASVVPDCSGDLASFGYNLVGVVDTVCTVGGGPGGDQLGTTAEPLDPELGPLADHGGPTPTHLPTDGSPVVDAGDPDGCRDADEDLLSADQRDHLRHHDGPGPGSEVRCDIGSVELAAPSGELFADGFESGGTGAWSTGR